VAFADARQGRSLPPALTAGAPAVAALVWRLLAPDPALRPTASELLEHPLLGRGWGGGGDAGAGGAAAAVYGTAAMMDGGTAGGGGDAGAAARGGADDGRVLYRGTWHDAQSILKLLLARDEEVSALRLRLQESSKALDRPADRRQPAPGDGRGCVT